MFIEAIRKTDPSSIGAAYYLRIMVYVAPTGLASYLMCFVSINISLLPEPCKS